MTENALSARFSLPLLIAGQAQKEVTWNESLALIDALMAMRVESAGENAAPAAPLPGQCWIVGDAPTGAWTGAAGKAAISTVGGWRFVPMPLFSVVCVGSNGQVWRKLPGGWSALSVPAAPSGGTTIDVECRAALAAILTLLGKAGFAP